TPTYGVVTVTALARREGPRAPSPAEEARGAAWGRVLHQLLEAAMRNPQLELRPLAVDLMHNEEVAPDLLGDVLRVAASVTASDLWARALGSPRRYVEVPFEMVVPSRELGLTGGPDQTLLKGAMDLVFEEEGVWHVVDWKSDAIAGPEGLAALVAHYAPQVAHYRRAWEALTGKPARAGLYFVDTGHLEWLETGDQETSSKGQGATGGGRVEPAAAKPPRRQASLFDD
ncbi:MAG: PD-(D/E)XK nuclease family protein, partial [Thermoanaerobaculia bacterium]